MVADFHCESHLHFRATLPLHQELVEVSSDLMSISWPIKKAGWKYHLPLPPPVLSLEIS